MVIRIYRILSDEDKQRFQEKFQANINKTSGQYIYHLKASNLPHELEKMGQLYQWVEDYLARRWQNRIYEIPKEHRKLRNNVEATVNEFVCKMPGKKLKVRGAFKAAVFVYSVAISINSDRIYRLILDDPEYFKAFLFFIFKIVNERINFMKFLYRFWIVQLILKENSVSTLPPWAKWRVESRCF